MFTYCSYERAWELCPSSEWMRLLDTQQAEENRTASRQQTFPSDAITYQNWLGKTQGSSQLEFLIELFIFHWWASYTDLVASGFHHRWLICWDKQQPLLETPPLLAPLKGTVFTPELCSSSLPAAVREPAHPRHGARVWSRGAAPHMTIYQCNVHYTRMLCNVLQAYNAQVCYICSVELYRFHVCESI